MTDEVENKEEKQVDIEKVVKDFCVEYSSSCLRTEAERDYRKDAIAAISEKTGIEKKVLAFCGRTFHKQDFDEKAVQQAEMQLFYANIFGEANMNTDSDDFDPEDNDDDDF